LTRSQRLPQETRISTLNLRHNFLLIRYDSSNVVVHFFPLSGNVGAHIPAVRLRNQRGITQFINVFLKRQRSLGRWGKLGDVVLAQVRNRLDDPCTLNFHTGRSVGESRRSLWAVDEKQIGKAVDRQAETAGVSTQRGEPSVGNVIFGLTRSSRRLSSGLGWSRHSSHVDQYR